MEDTNPQLDRRDFMGLAAAMAAIGVGAALPVATAAAAPGPSTDFTRWLDSIPGKHRVLLDMREPNGGLAFAWAWVWLLTAPQAYGGPESDVGAAIVLRHNAIPVALDDSAWGKYKLGEFFKIDDPETGKPAVPPGRKFSPRQHFDRADACEICGNSFLRRQGGVIRHG